jgi:CheY-like chemotaxis protein
MPGKSVIFIDDDEDELLFITQAFKNCGITNELHTFTVGKQLMEALLEGNVGKPCLIVLGLNLQEMNGMKILDALNKNKQYSKIPVVVLSTSNSEMDIKKAISKGVVDYIPKPYTLEGYNFIATKLASTWCI